jgi:hypothetical protein
MQFGSRSSISGVAAFRLVHAMAIVDEITTEPLPDAREGGGACRLCASAPICGRIVPRLEGSP